MVSFAASFAIALIVGFFAIWIIGMVREGLGRGGRVIFFERWFSPHAVKGIVLLPVVAIFFLCDLLEKHLSEGIVPVIAGTLAGVSLAVGAWWGLSRRKKVG